MRVRALFIPLAVVAGVMTAATCSAAAPKGSTGECKDGSYTSAENKSGACSGHGGVKDWYGNEKASAAKPTAKAESTAEAPKGATGECKDGSYTSADNKSGACSAHGGIKNWYSRENEASRGGAAPKVWVNTETNVYHCSDDRWYGKTQKGEYMSEADAKSKGLRADHGKGCN
jgi:uncharacterized protein with FMN-binding domain